jgi:hypothetical protein
VKEDARSAFYPTQVRLSEADTITVANLRVRVSERLACVLTG